VIFTETAIPDLWIVDLEPISDERGWFSRSYDEDEFARRGLNTSWPQWSTSFNKRAGTVRGMHFQGEPHGEVKLVTCLTGAIEDAVIDLRPQSKSFKQCFQIRLEAGSGRALYIPSGFAHGFQTLEDDTSVGYHIGTRFVPGSGAGVRWNDPAFSPPIAWPLSIAMIADKDKAWPDFQGPR
jgi:dTDP-4-dehydrorhamnose 3,5-epimerase